MSIERVCVVGGGVIGSLYAAHLSRVADVWVLTRRPEHARALEEQGLEVSGRSEFTGRVHATDDPAELPDVDAAILATKGTAVDAAAGASRGGSWGAMVVTVQNGLGAEQIVRRHGDWPLVSGVTFMSGTRHGDRHVEYILDTETRLGPYNGIPYERVQELVELIERSGLKARAFPDLKPAQWSKLIFNATVNAVAALTGLPHDPHFAAEERSPTSATSSTRSSTRARPSLPRRGSSCTEHPWEMNVLATRRGSAHYPSMLEDVEARRPTEIELITGSLVREAERLGVPTPLHPTLYRLIKAKEDSYRESEGGRDDGKEAVGCLCGASRSVGARRGDGRHRARRLADDRQAPIVIGWAFDSKGNMALFDGPALAAAKVRVGQINARGGVMGRPLRIDTCDTNNNNPAKAKS